MCHALVEGCPFGTDDHSFHVHLHRAQTSNKTLPRLSVNFTEIPVVLGTASVLADF